MTTSVLSYIIFMNIITLAAFGVDKYRAIKGRWRISETMLLSLSAFGGSLGALIGMFVFRHKTLKTKFTAGIPFLLFLQIVYMIIICKI